MSRHFELAQKDELDRDAMESVRAAVLQMNETIRAAMDRGIRVELGVVSTPDRQSAEAREWRRPWTKEGFAARFTREEIAASPLPAPEVKDASPGGGTF